MKPIRLLLAAVLGALLALPAGRRCPERSDQRSRRHVPVPDLLEVVLRVQQAPPRGRDQLPVDRIRRRHPPAHQPDGLLRRHRRPDDRRAAAGGAPGASCTCRRCSAASCRSTTSPASTAQLKFTGKVLADIIMGKITKWNDAAITALNPGVPLPDLDITVAHRSDGSGTTYIFVDYLSKVSPEFKKTVGVATAVNWPVGVGGKGNEGVAGLVKQTPGSIGYVELIYAMQNKIDYGSVQNMDGEFVSRHLESVTAAAAVAGKAMPKDFRVSITNAPGKGVYPISSFTWILLYESPNDKQRAKIMVDFMKWALTDGQKFAAELGYAPLARRGRRRWRWKRSRRSRSESRSREPSMKKTPSRAGARTTAAFASGRGSSHSSSSSSSRDLLRALSHLRPVDRQVRLQLLADDDVGSRGRASSAPFRSSGARSTRRSWRCSSRRPIALGIAIFLSELSPRVAAHTADVPDGAAGRDSRRSCTGCGGSSCSCRSCGSSSC